MKDITRLNEIKPLQAEGRCTIELTDPITGKVKERVGGKNMVFPETLMVNRWWERINSAYTVLGDDDTPSSLDFPFMRGQTIGYGQPSQAGSGLYKGSYNASNQILCRQGEGKLSWKFQYDFTAPQAIGTIKAVSLTNQFATNSYEVNFYAQISGGSYYYRDGKYGYSVTTAGIITITNLYNAISTTIDISEFLQNNNARHIAIDKASGKGYITERVASNILIHEFSDNTFSEKINSYTISDTFDDQWLVNSNWCLVKGDSIYLGTQSNLIAKINYTDNTLVKFIEAPITIWGNLDNRYPPPLHINDDFVYFSRDYMSVLQCYFKFKHDTIEATVKTPYNVGTFLMTHPLATHPLPCTSSTSGRVDMLPCAITNYVLPTPVEKTNDKGMTVTYELDVYW